MSLRNRTDHGRRNALKALGLASAATVAYPLGPGLTGRVTAGAAERLTSQRFKVGVLLPSSDYRPSPAGNFKAGMELHLERMNYQCAGRAISLAAHDIGTGVRKAVGTSRDLVEKERADLVIGLLNPRTSLWLREIYETNRTPFIEASAGERIVDEGNNSPWIFHNSLALWQSSLALGRWAARNVGRQAVIASSMHDSGFDTLRAFRYGFEEGGGKVTEIYVTEPTQGMTHADVVRQIAKARPDVVGAFYSRGDAADFINAYSNAGLAGEIPVLGSGFMADPRARAAMASSGINVRCSLSWSDGIDTEENRSFIAAYRSMYGVAPDPFALLGYDTARMVCAALESLGGTSASGDALRRALGSVAFTSPRGELTVDGRTNTLLSPLYLSEMRHSVSGMGNRIVETFSPAEGASAAPALAAQCGWLNSYLSV